MERLLDDVKGDVEIHCAIILLECDGERECSLVFDNGDLVMFEGVFDGALDLFNIFMVNPISV